MFISGLQNHPIPISCQQVAFLHALMLGLRFLTSCNSTIFTKKFPSSLWSFTSRYREKKSMENHMKKCVWGLRPISILFMFHWLLLSKMPHQTSTEGGRYNLVVTLGRGGNGFGEQLASPSHLDLLVTYHLYLCLSLYLHLYLYLYTNGQLFHSLNFEKQQCPRASS